MKKVNQDYWQRRAVRYERDWNKRCAETVEKRLARHYERALSAIKDDILQLYATFAKDNGLDFNEARRALSSREFREWRMSMREYIEANDAGLTRELNTLAMQPRISRLEKLYGETLQELDKLGRNVSDEMRNFLTGAYKDNYSRDIFDLVKVGGLSVALAHVDSPSVEKVLSARWSGKNYSQRIWTNTRLLSKTVRETVATGVHRGLSIPQLSKMVEDKMHGGYGNAVRLVQTEMSFVNNQAHADSMEAAGIAWYEFIATLDNRTSAPCRSRDGEAYPLEEKTVGFNYPPLHPRCRSTVAPFIDGVSKSGTRIAKVGKDTIHIPASMSYRDYESVYVKKEKTFKQWQSQKNFKSISMLSSSNTYQPFPRTLDEAQRVAENLNPIVDKYFIRKSKWSGKVVVGTRGTNHKLPSCDIGILLSDCPDEAILHELVHAHSTSYYSNKIYVANNVIEEASVQFLTQEIAKRERITLSGSGYDFWTTVLREFNRRIKAYDSDLKFAQRLLRVPMEIRMDWLFAKARKFVNDNSGNISDLMKLSELLSKLSWEALSSWNAKR